METWLLLGFSLAFLGFLLASGSSCGAMLTRPTIELLYFDVREWQLEIITNIGYAQIWVVAGVWVLPNQPVQNDATGFDSLGPFCPRNRLR